MAHFERLLNGAASGSGEEDSTLRTAAANLSDFLLTIGRKQQQVARQLPSNHIDALTLISKDDIVIGDDDGDDLASTIQHHHHHQPQEDECTNGKTHKSLGNVVRLKTSLAEPRAAPPPIVTGSDMSEVFTMPPPPPKNDGPPLLRFYDIADFIAKNSSSSAAAAAAAAMAMDDGDDGQPENGGEQHSGTTIVPASVPPHAWDPIRAIIANVAAEKMSWLQSIMETDPIRTNRLQPYVLTAKHAALLFSEPFSPFSSCAFGELCYALQMQHPKGPFAFVQEFSPAQYAEYLRTGERPHNMSPFCVFCNHQLRMAVVHRNRASSHNTHVVPIRHYALVNQPGEYRQRAIYGANSNSGYTDGLVLPVRNYVKSDFVPGERMEMFRELDGKQLRWVQKPIRCFTERPELFFTNNNNASEANLTIQPCVTVEQLVLSPELYDILCAELVPKIIFTNMCEPVSVHHVEQRVNSIIQAMMTSAAAAGGRSTAEALFTLVPCFEHLGVVRANDQATINVMLEPRVPLFLRLVSMLFRPLDQARAHVMAILTNNQCYTEQPMDFLNDYEFNGFAFFNIALRMPDIQNALTKVSFLEHICFYVTLNVLNLVARLQTQPASCNYEYTEEGSGRTQQVHLDRDMPAHTEVHLVSLGNAYVPLLNWYRTRIDRQQPFDDSVLLTRSPASENATIGDYIEVPAAELADSASFTDNNTWYEILKPVPRDYHTPDDIATMQVHVETRYEADGPLVPSTLLMDFYCSPPSAARTVPLAVQNKLSGGRIVEPWRPGYEWAICDFRRTIEFLSRTDNRRCTIPLDQWLPKLRPEADMIGTTHLKSLSYAKLRGVEEAQLPNEWFASYNADMINRFVIERDDYAQWWHPSLSDNNSRSGHLILAALVYRVNVASALLGAEQNNVNLLLVLLASLNKTNQFVPIRSFVGASAADCMVHPDEHELYERFGAMQVPNDDVRQVTALIEERRRVIQLLKRFLGAHTALANLLDVEAENSADELNDAFFLSESIINEDQTHMSHFERLYPFEWLGHCYENMFDLTGSLSETDLLGCTRKHVDTLIPAIFNALVPHRTNVGEFWTLHENAMQSNESYYQLFASCMIATLTGAYSHSRNIPPFQKRIEIESLFTSTVPAVKEAIIKSFSSGGGAEYAGLYAMREYLISLIRLDPAFRHAMCHEFSQYVRFEEECVIAGCNMIRSAVCHNLPVASMETRLRTKMEKRVSDWARASTMLGTQFIYSMRTASQAVQQSRIVEQITLERVIPEAKSIRPPRAIIELLVQFIHSLEPGEPFNPEWMKMIGLTERAYLQINALFQLGETQSKDKLIASLRNALTPADCSIAVFFFNHLVFYYARRMIPLPAYFAHQQLEAVRRKFKIPRTEGIAQHLVSAYCCPITGCNCMHTFLVQKKRFHGGRPMRYNLEKDTVVCAIKRAKPQLADQTQALRLAIERYQKANSMSLPLMEALELAEQRRSEVRLIKQTLNREAKKFARRIENMRDPCSDFPMDSYPLAGFIMEHRQPKQHEECEAIRLCNKCGVFTISALCMYGTNGFSCCICDETARFGIAETKTLRCDMCGSSGAMFRRMNARNRLGDNLNGTQSWRQHSLCLVDEAPETNNTCQERRVCASCFHQQMPIMQEQFTRQEINAWMLKYARNRTHNYMAYVENTPMLNVMERSFGQKKTPQQLEIKQ